MNFSTTNIKIDSYMHFPVFLFFRIEYPKTMPKNFLLIISVIANLQKYSFLATKLNSFQ